MNNNNSIILEDSLESLHQRVWALELPTTGDFYPFIVMRDLQK